MSVLGRWVITLTTQEERVFVYSPFSWCMAKQVKHLWGEGASGTPSYSNCSWVSWRLHSSPRAVINCLFFAGEAGSEEQGFHLQVLPWQRTLRIDSGNIKRQKWKWELGENRSLIQGDICMDQIASLTIAIAKLKISFTFFLLAPEVLWVLVIWSRSWHFIKFKKLNIARFVVTYCKNYFAPRRRGLVS